MKVKIGCCGFPKSRKQYYMEFNVVELQNTFYKLPSKEWGVKLRREAPEDFEFTMKAWQAITHPPSSPTWRKLRITPPGKKENYGYLKPTEENLSAWRRVLEYVDILRAHVIVLQTPPSFGYSLDNMAQVDSFFERAVKELGNRTVFIGWEPRGSWRDHVDDVKRIVCRHGVVHIVDPLRMNPVICSNQTLLYFRLHGLGGREVNYRYKYSDNDLSNLARKIHRYLNENTGIYEVYVMFNNVYMFDDAQRFRKIASSYFNEINANIAVI